MDLLALFNQRLLCKLEHYGIRGPLLTWIGNFLQGRDQQVVHECATSEKAEVSSGVPQGTVMGSLCFLAFINNLPECITQGSQARIFADDTILYRMINSPDDAAKLQSNLDALQDWEKKWMMEFHPGKCQVLWITKRRNPVIHTYSIHGQPLEVVDSAKYLGVEISNNISWNKHIDKSTKKGQNAVGFLR